MRRQLAQALARRALCALDGSGEAAAASSVTSAFPSSRLLPNWIGPHAFACLPDASSPRRSTTCCSSSRGSTLLPQPASAAHFSAEAAASDLRGSAPGAPAAGAARASASASASAAPAAAACADLCHHGRCSDKQGLWRWSCEEFGASSSHVLKQGQSVVHARVLGPRFFRGLGTVSPKLRQRDLPGCSPRRSFRNLPVRSLSNSAGGGYGDSRKGSDSIDKAENSSIENAIASLYKPTKAEDDDDEVYGDLSDRFFEENAVSDDDLDSLLVMKNLQGVPGLPPLEDLLNEVSEEEMAAAERRSEEKRKQEAQQQQRVRVVDGLGRAYATGKRKTSVARVWLSAGDPSLVAQVAASSALSPAQAADEMVQQTSAECGGKASAPSAAAAAAAGGVTTESAASSTAAEAAARVSLAAASRHGGAASLSNVVTVNGKLIDLYFADLGHRALVLQPFLETGTLGLFRVMATVKGGGLSGQAGALRHGISKALQLFDPSLRPQLKSAGLLTRDPRVVERKKPGKAKARKSFQWVKR